MIKRISGFYISLLIVGSMTLHAESTVSRTYEFEPNRPNAIDNPLFWQLDTQCLIVTMEGENLLKGTMKRNNATINGRYLSEGESTTLTVRNKEFMHIVADRGARVEIINFGKKTVTATCKI